MHPIRPFLLLPALCFAGCAAPPSPATPAAAAAAAPTTMDLGAFSVSLAVKDLPASRAFYEKLGFRAVAGDPAQHWLILRNGDANIGLFQGAIAKNMLTFNPGWSHTAEPLPQFTDVREIQRRLEAQGLQMVLRADESTTGPASLMLVDPDGNQILLDQHVR